jgi:hypothetical protein
LFSRPTASRPFGLELRVLWNSGAIKQKNSWSISYVQFLPQIVLWKKITVAVLLCLQLVIFF